MRVFISADIEGAAATVSRPECNSAEAVYRKYADIMTREVAAVCEGAIQGGASEIVVKDAHGGANNIDIERLPSGVRLLRGFSGHPYCMVEGIERGFDAAMFIGYHAAAGSPGNPLSHTISGSSNYILINGRPASEFMVYGYAAALEGVPPVLLSGDQAVCEDALELAPWLVTVAAKEGRGTSVLSKTPADVCCELRAAAETAVQQAAGAQPLRLPRHFDVEVNFKDHTHAYKKSFYPGVLQKDAKTLSFHAEDYFDVLRLLTFIL